MTWIFLNFFVPDPNFTQEYVHCVVPVKKRANLNKSVDLLTRKVNRGKRKEGRGSSQTNNAILV